VLGLLHGQGFVRIDGDEVSGKPTHLRVQDHGVAAVHERRGLLKDLTVREYVVVGNKLAASRAVSAAVELVPVLKDRLSERVSNLSGGKQQMIAVGRAVLREPQYVLLDEPSLGLAPSVVDDIYRSLAVMHEPGLTNAAREAERAPSDLDRRPPVSAAHRRHLARRRRPRPGRRPALHGNDLQRQGIHPLHSPEQRR